MITETAATLKEQLPGWNVLAEAGTLTEVRELTAVLVPVKVDRVDAVKLHVQPVYAAWILAPAQDSSRFEARLERALFEFVQGLEATGRFTWDTAARGILDQTYTGYRLELNPTFTLTLGD